MKRSTLLLLAGCVCACGSSTNQGDAGNNPDSGTTPDSSADSSPTNDSGDSSSGTGPVIFVIPMENEGQAAIYGDTTDAPYINGTLLTTYAHTTMFADELPALDSEPHYVWMESGTNQFSDHTFTTDNDSSASNSTSSTAHLVTQLSAASVSWTSYQEGITSGTCPIASVTGMFYAAKHNPFVFFQDVAGNPPSASNTSCANHHKPITDLATDLQNGTVSAYNFVTPNLCHDMHGDPGCTQGTAANANIAAGDAWLKANLQPMIDYALAHDGFVFVTWDQGAGTDFTIPFIAIGKKVIAGHAGSVMYTHSSLLKSEEEILGVPVLSAVTTANDFSDLFTSFP
jgi:hypothetical protein